jgi:TPP-dependent pyruvate/acetoin dehydrogenase alpha subunit
MKPLKNYGLKQNNSYIGADMTEKKTGYSKEFLLSLYRRMYLVREFELRAIEERRNGLIPGFIHSCVGQEATAVGACMALDVDDVITSTHRGHGHLLGKGGDPKYMMAELAARSSGYCKGRGGSLHIADFDLGILGANGIVGGGFPTAVGAALAFHMRNEKHVALCFFGDGAINQGTFHESANMAGLWKLPVIFFCENNLYGEGTPQEKQAPIKDLAKRAESYGFPGLSVDGNDPLAVYEATKKAVTRAKKDEGPTLIEGKTYRFRGHYEGDPQVYRLPGEMEEWKKKDPIPNFRKWLLKSGSASENEIKNVEESVQHELDEAVAFAKSAPIPKVEEALEGVYADIHNGKVF